MMRLSAVANAAAAIVLMLAATPFSALAGPANKQAAGWNVMNCNGHTHVVWGPVWLAPNHRMQTVFIQDRDHDNFTPLKLTVNNVSIKQGEGCGNGPDSNFSSTPAEQPVGGVVSNSVQLLAKTCHGPRVYDINVTCEHDGDCGNGTSVCPAFGTIDLLVTVGGKRPADQNPQTPTEQ